MNNYNIDQLTKIPKIDTNNTIPRMLDQLSILDHFQTWELILNLILEMEIMMDLQDQATHHQINRSQVVEAPLISELSQTPEKILQ